MQEARQFTNANFVLPGPGNYESDQSKNLVGGAMGRSERTAYNQSKINEKEPGPSNYQPSLNFTKPHVQTYTMPSVSDDFHGKIKDKQID